MIMRRGGDSPYQPKDKIPECTYELQEKRGAVRVMLALVSVLKGPEEKAFEERSTSEEDVYTWVGPVELRRRMRLAGMSHKTAHWGFKVAERIWVNMQNQGAGEFRRHVEAELRQITTVSTGRRQWAVYRNQWLEPPHPLRVTKQVFQQIREGKIWNEYYSKPPVTSTMARAEKMATIDELEAGDFIMIRMLPPGKGESTAGKFFHLGQINQASRHRAEQLGAPYTEAGVSITQWTHPESTKKPITSTTREVARETVFALPSSWRVDGEQNGVCRRWMDIEKEIANICYCPVKSCLKKCKNIWSYEDHFQVHNKQGTEFDFASEKEYFGITLKNRESSQRGQWA